MATNYHSRILRESLRDGTYSVASSTGSQHGTVSPDSTFSNMSFNPDQDDPYSESTRIMEDPSLPRLRDTARKYKYSFARSRSPELLIDTSALRKSFPNFSQAGSPRDRIDMEKIARYAAQHRNKDPTPTRMAKPDTTNQQKPLTPLAKEQNQRVPNLQKENVTPSSYVSGATRTRDGTVRRTLADLHPKVRDESDFSFASDHIDKSGRVSGMDFTQQSQNTTTTQPAKTQPTTKTTRMTSQKVGPIKSANSQKLASNKPQPAKAQDDHTIASSNMRNPTQSSFLLPKDIPEISDLVTATFKDGSPVYVQSGAVQSRFSSAGKRLPQKHVAVDGIEVPQDEQDIFLSLQTMQERITQLEGEKSDAQRIANDLDKENYKLREEVKQGRRRSDSAIADTGADAEKSRLQDEINNLKHEAEASKRKIQTLELHLTNNTTERDRAISRVAEYNKTCERLKSENMGLKNEVDALNQHSQRELKQNETSWQVLREELEHKVAVLEDNAAGYEHYIADIRKLYAELEQSSKEEVASLKQQLQNSKDFYHNSANQHEQKEGDFQEREEAWKAKTYRLEKALRMVLGLKYEKYLVTKNLVVGASSQRPIFIAEASKPTPNPSKQVRSNNAFEDSAIQGTAPTKKSSLSPTKENGGADNTGKDMLFGATFQKTTPSAGNRVTPNTLPKQTASPVNITPNDAVGPKTALVNAAIKAYGLEDFTWEFDHNDDLTRSTDMESIIGAGVKQQLKDDVANARQMQAANSNGLDANRGNTSQQRSPFSNNGENDSESNAEVQTSHSLHQGNNQGQMDEHSQFENDCQFDLRLPKNPARLNKSPDKFQGFSNLPETPLGGTQQRSQQRRHSEGVLDTTVDEDQTNMTDLSGRSTVLRRTRSQTSAASKAGRTSRVSHHRRSNSDNITSAYIIPDIDVPQSIASKQSRPRRHSDIPVCGHGLPYQGPQQCDTCARTASSIVDAQDSYNKYTKLVPVSERMPSASNGQDEPTLRPSMPPMDALAEVLKSLLEEERKMKKKLSELHYHLNSHDSSLGRSKRAALAAEYTKVLAESQKKADQIYFLHDVLEGLKETEEWQGIQD